MVGHSTTIRSIRLHNGKHALVLPRSHWYEGHGIRSVVHPVRTAAAAGVETIVQFTGPHYETPAEVKMAKAIGGDLVGMSTALETIAARESKLEVLGLSLMTNLAAGIQTTPLSHKEVLEAGKEAEGRISALLAEIIAKL